MSFIVEWPHRGGHHALEARTAVALLDTLGIAMGKYLPFGFDDLRQPFAGCHVWII